VDERGGSEAEREKRGGETVLFESFFLVRAAPEQRGCVVLVSGELGGEFWYLWYGGWRGDVLTWVSGAWSGGRWVGWWFSG
jgi:hypothetical protein